MVKVSFFVRKDVKTLPVYASVTWSSTRVKIATGENLDKLTGWSQKRGRCTSSQRGYLNINRRLDQLEDDIKDLFRSHKAMTPALLKDLISMEDQDPDPRAQAVFENYLKKNSHLLAHETVRRLKTSMNMLKQFDDSIRVSHINQDLISEFINWNLDKGLASSTVHTHLKVIKVILKEVGQDSSFVRINYRHTERVFLTEEELFALYQCPMPSEALSRVKDLFAFSCFTGMRFSDIIALKPEHLHGDTVRIVQKKHGKANLIPLNKYALDIWSRHSGGFRCISNQKANKYIKDVAEIAGIDTLVTVVRYSGAKRKEILVPKFRVVSFHVGRHTYATLSLSKGMDLAILSEILGHSDIKTSLIYAKLMDNKKVEAVRSAWDHNSDPISLTRSS